MNFKKTLIKCHNTLFYKYAKFQWVINLFVSDFFKIVRKKLNYVFGIFRRKIFLNWCIKSYECICIKNLEEKSCKNHYFQDFGTKKLLQKFSENLFLVRLKIHHTPYSSKFFQNVLSSMKISSPKVDIPFFVKVFIFIFMNFFHFHFKFSDSGIVALTENV